jgi:hypothetical protein
MYPTAVEVTPGTLLKAASTPQKHPAAKQAVWRAGLLDGDRPADVFSASLDSCMTEAFSN